MRTFFNPRKLLVSIVIYSTCIFELKFEGQKVGLRDYGRVAEILPIEKLMGTVWVLYDQKNMFLGVICGGKADGKVYFSVTCREIHVPENMLHVKM